MSAASAIGIDLGTTYRCDGSRSSGLSGGPRQRCSKGFAGRGAGADGGSARPGRHRDCRPPPPSCCCCSCVGVWQHDRVEIIPNDQGNRTTPSCVAFSDTERLVGDAAMNQARAPRRKLHCSSCCVFLTCVCGQTTPQLLPPQPPASHLAPPPSPPHTATHCRRRRSP